jgi:2-polyprenyl-3-methyl-5-hydroxy-6-metoxy-1,4-benzoquinol methylase
MTHCSMGRRLAVCIHRLPGRFGRLSSRIATDPRPESMSTRPATPSRDLPIERVRQFWDQRPCNIRHSPREVGTREYFDEVEARKYFVEPHIPGFAQFDRWADKRVLEIGCGIGTDTINFARAGARVTAVDLSERSLDLARRRAVVCGLEDRITFVLADGEHLSSFVAPERYDLVYSFGVLHHTPHPERAIDEIRQHYLAPDGLLKLMLYHRFSWKVLGILLGEERGAFWRLGAAVARNSEAQTGCPVTYVYSRGDVRRLLGGFHVLEMWVDHIFPYRVEDYVRYRYAKARPFRWLPAPAMRTLERTLGWHLCVTARLAEPAFERSDVLPGRTERV